MIKHSDLWRAGTFLATSVLMLSACGTPGGGGNEIIKGEKEGDVCKGENSCPSGLICYEEQCLLTCGGTIDCAPDQICKNSVCLTHDNADCHKNEDCNRPGQCESQNNAVCLGAKCIYEFKDSGKPCDDDNQCTENDVCDGNGHCAGTAIVCNDPPESYCSEDDVTFYTFSVGSCRQDTGECEYQPTTTNCSAGGCRATCLKVCNDYEGQCETTERCKVGQCDPLSTNNPPCKAVDAPQGTACVMDNENAGFCESGNCYECLKDSDCQAEPSPWTECYQAECKDHVCEYGFVDSPCGKKCVNGYRYDVYGTCVAGDSSDMSTISCETTSKVFCNGFACDDEHKNCLTSCSSNNDCFGDYFCDVGSGKCLEKLANGADGCSDDFMCKSGHCDLDSQNGPEINRCCDSGDCCDANSDCPLEFVCDNYQCTSEAVGKICTEDSDCNSATYCDKIQGKCATKLLNAAACEGDNQCQNGQCVDGVCCQQSECGLCQACNIAGHEGSCFNVAAGFSDDTCLEAAGNVCNKYNECVKRDGQSCNSNSECASSNCVDKVCCNTSSCGTCEACNVKGHEGSCAFVGDGENDQDSCQVNSNSKCKQFDGNIICSKNNGQAANNASECFSGYLVDGVCCENSCDTPDVCNAGVTVSYSCKSGKCEQQEVSCGNYGCNSNNTACSGSCAKNSDCSAGFFCNGDGKCVAKLQNGALCISVLKSSADAVGSACINGNCVDGYCCNTACDKADDCSGTNKVIYACDVSGSVGVCTDQQSSCGIAKCENGKETLPVCANGNCSSVQNDCGAYSCGGARCRTSCSVDGDCRNSNYYCDGSTCKAKMDLASTCSSDRECASGNCIDGVCCDRSCGICEKCNLSGHLGDCTFVGVGQNDDDSCKDSSKQCVEVGLCLKRNGQTATYASECASTYLVDGVCCASPSCGGGQYYQCESTCTYSVVSGTCQKGTGTCTSAVVSTGNAVADGQVCENGRLVEPNESTNCHVDNWAINSGCALANYYYACKDGKCPSPFYHAKYVTEITDKAPIGSFYYYSEGLKTTRSSDNTFWTCSTGSYDYASVHGYCDGNGNFIFISGEEECSQGDACFDYDDGSGGCEGDH